MRLEPQLPLLLRAVGAEDLHRHGRPVDLQQEEDQQRHRQHGQDHEKGAFGEEDQHR